MTEGGGRIRNLSPVARLAVVFLWAQAWLWTGFIAEQGVMSLRDCGDGLDFSLHNPSPPPVLPGVVPSLADTMKGDGCFYFSSAEVVYAPVKWLIGIHLALFLVAMLGGMVSCAIWLIGASRNATLLKRVNASADSNILDRRARSDDRTGRVLLAAWITCLVGGWAIFLTLINIPIHHFSFWIDLALAFVATGPVAASAILFAQIIRRVTRSQIERSGQEA